MSLVTTNPESTNNDSLSPAESAGEVAPPRTRVQAYIELTKLRITVMVLLTFACAAVLSAIVASQTITLGVMVCGLAGMLLIASSGNAMNMYVERYSDFLMPRTANRPLPAKELTATEVVMFGAVSLGVGLAFLFGGVNWQTGVCGIVNWILYVFVYTPMKRHSPLNTEVGAIAGAMPVIMGSLATTGTVGLLGWSFFGVLFFWQFPHFFAIAWKYRDQYRMGGLKMLTVTEPTGRAAGIKAVITGALLLAVSLLPMMLLDDWIRAGVFAVIAGTLGAVYLKSAIVFLQNRNDQTARKLLYGSLLYLPLYMLLLSVVFVV